MWIGELITERGIGNGISFIIFAGIVGQAPARDRRRSSQSPDIARSSCFVVLAIVVGRRDHLHPGRPARIPIQYASRVRGRRMYQGGPTFLPLRVNQAGVIPIIFAVSILLFPAQIALVLPDLARSTIVAEHLASASSSFFDPRSPLYVDPVLPAEVGFTYFYTAFTFKPDETADSCARTAASSRASGPGRPTRDYLARVVFRITPRRRAVPGHRRGRAVDRRRCSSRRWRLRPRRHRPADRGLRRGRDDEADRGAADDAQLRGLHSLRVRDRHARRARRRQGHPGGAPRRAARHARIVATGDLFRAAVARRARSSATRSRRTWTAASSCPTT